jgi:hypothetical protein
VQASPSQQFSALLCFSLFHPGEMKLFQKCVSGHRKTSPITPHVYLGIICFASHRGVHIFHLKEAVFLSVKGINVFYILLGNHVF